MDHQLEVGDTPGYLLLFTHDGEPKAKLSTIPVPKLTSTVDTAMQIGWDRTRCDGQYSGRLYENSDLWDECSTQLLSCYVNLPPYFCTNLNYTKSEGCGILALL